MVDQWFLNEILKPIFSHEAIIVIVKGFWKKGKTNVGLRIIEDLLESNIISVAGTNIKITETDKIKYIEDFESLKEFHFDHPTRPKHKGFIFDEAGKLTVRRRAMGKANVGWMQFIPELSKGRMKLIVITQSEFLTDNIFVNTEFTRATITAFHDPNWGYSIQVDSELIDYEHRRIYINKFPKCKTEYSAYESAEWFIEKRNKDKKESKLLCCKIARMYAVENLNSSKIANIKGFTSRKPVMDLLKRHLRHTLNKSTPEDIETMYKELHPSKDLKTDEILSEAVPT